MVNEKAERLLCTVVAVPTDSPSREIAADCAWCDSVGGIERLAALTLPWLARWLLLLCGVDVLLLAPLPDCALLLIGGNMAREGEAVDDDSEWAAGEAVLDVESGVWLAVLCVNASMEPREAAAGVGAGGWDGTGMDDELS